MRNVGMRILTTVIFATVVGALAMSGLSSAGAAAALDDGVTANSIKIGYITSITGVAASTTGDADKGCKARIGRENASGGVNGRKIEVEYVDDQSSGANKTGAQDLVQNKHVFMIVNNSAFAFLTYQFLLDNDVPIIGGGYDGTYYGAPGNENVISMFGNVVNANGVAYDLLPKFMKKVGATKTAVLGYGISPSSTASAESFSKFAVPSVPGLSAVYTNTTVDFGTTDVGPLVLGIKNAGADAAYLPMDANTNVAIVQGLAQNGVKMKADVLATGYGQNLLDQPVAKTFGPDVYLSPPAAPVELKTKATKRFQADLKKYAGVTGVPDFGLYTGYMSCELAILGLKNAGNPPTRAAFAPNLRKLGSYDAAGLACQPIDISLATYGEARPTQCGWFTQVKNGKFVPYPADGKPQVGKLIGASTVATTTTAAPS
jgi:branched-chain amino acid transport system substrate-binding protein